MRFLLTTDWHLSDTKPEKRTDDYCAAQYKKVTQILEIAKQTESNILHAGDFFDSFRVSEKLKADYIDLITSYNKKIFAVYGQHDMRYRNKQNTPLSVLEAADVVYDVSNEPIDMGGVRIHGCSWAGIIPKPTANKINILVIHKMILKEPVWWAEDALIIDGALELGFDLIVSGDNHNQFVKTDRNRTLVNPGSLMRMTTQQIDYEPSVFVYDFDREDVAFTCDLENHTLYTEPSVFDLAVIESEATRNEQLDSFVAGLKEDTKLHGLDFLKNIETFCKVNNISDREVDMLNEVCK